MKGFYFLVWLLFIYERVIVKNPLRFNREKICSIYYMRFSFKKLETIPSTFLSIFFPEIYLELLIIGVVFLHYT